MSNFNRRNLLKKLGLVTGALSMNVDSKAKEIQEIVFPNNPKYISIDNPVTAIVLGAGNRGNVYGRYAVAFPKDVKMVGVAEPIEFIL